MREDELRALLNTTEEGGTPPENIVNVSRMLGFYAEMRTNLSLSDLEAAVNAGMPVIVGTQAWRGNTSQQSWVNDWADGHYMVVIGLDGRNVYLEDPAMLGTRGVIPRDEFLTRWHDFRGPGATDPGSIIYRRLAVFVRGEAPADYPVFTYVG
jgi:predicted double-glycine peptidase